MIRRLLSPPYLVPFCLVSPYVFVGPYGVTVVEAAIVFAFAALALPALLRGTFRLPVLLCIYLALFLVGWLGALVNGLKWQMPVGLENLSFFYKVVLAIGGYYLGYQLYQSADAIVTHRVFHVVIIGLAIVAALYPFITYEQRVTLLRFFYAAGPDELVRLQSPRFPGLGINANIYSFMVCTLLLFAFDAYVRRLVSAFVPLLAFVVIVTASSKLVISLSVGGCLLILARRLVSVKAHVTGVKVILVSRRSLSVASVLLMFSVGVFIYLTQTSTGHQIIETVGTVDRFAQAFGDSGSDSSFDTRRDLWNRGLERVKLAPVLGIVRNRFLSDDNDTLLFAYPHNEFIAQWMFYGVTGMLAHVVLLCGLIIINLRGRAALVWPLLYFALIAQMVFDGALEYVRFYAMFFVLVGLNMRYLYIKGVCDPTREQFPVRGTARVVL